MIASSLPVGTTSHSRNPWQLWLVPSSDALSPVSRAWVDAFCALFPRCVDNIQARWPLPEGVTAHVVLGGESENRAWHVDEDALGFHALCVPVSSEEGDALSVAPDHRCYVNVGNHPHALKGRGALTVEDALMTLPYEMANLAIFARATDGRTPAQVFEADGGELGLTRLLARIEESHCSDESPPHAHQENPVDVFASRVVQQSIAMAVVDVSALRPAAPQAPARKRWFGR